MSMKKITSTIESTTNSETSCKHENPIISWLFGIAFDLNSELTMKWKSVFYL